MSFGKGEDRFVEERATLTQLCPLGLHKSRLPGPSPKIMLGGARIFAATCSSLGFTVLNFAVQHTLTLFEQSSKYNVGAMIQYTTTKLCGSSGV